MNSPSRNLDGLHFELKRNISFVHTLVAISLKKIKNCHEKLLKYFTMLTLK